MRFNLPSCIAELIEARNRVRDHYADRMGGSPAHNRLKFTLDGNLLGDLGEALAVELFGIKLVDGNAFEGIDGFAPDGRTTVQVKVTASHCGPAFRKTETHADHLIFFDLDCQSAFKRDPLWSHIGVQKGTTRGAAVELARQSG